MPGSRPPPVKGRKQHENTSGSCRSGPPKAVEIGFQPPDTGPPLLARIRSQTPHADIIGSFLFQSKSFAPGQAYRLPKEDGCDLSSQDRIRRREAPNGYRCKADSRRITKCWHVSSAQVNRPAIPSMSAFVGIAQVQWPQVGFSIHVRAGEKYRHNSHRCSIIAGLSLSEASMGPSQGAASKSAGGRTCRLARRPSGPGAFQRQQMWMRKSEDYNFFASSKEPVG